MQLRNLLLSGAIVLSLTQGQEAIAQKKATATKKLLDPANLDTSVKPGDNFFLYANGTWLKNNPIPADQTRWGSFSELQERNLNALHEILETTAKIKNAPKNSINQKVGDFYRTGMDTAAIEKAGITPLNGLFAEIDRIKDAATLQETIAHMYTTGNEQVYGFYVSPDDKIVTKQISQFSQGGLGMPGKEYYFDQDARTTTIRDAYKQYIPKMLQLMGIDAPTSLKYGTEIFNLESQLASACLTRVEMRDPIKMYNKYDLATINAMTQGIDWKLTLSRLKVNGEDSVLISNPAFFVTLAKLYNTVPMDVWKMYLKYQTVNDFSGYLSSKFDKAHFEFYGKVMSGQEVQTTRWKRVLSMVDGSIGDLLGQLYVAKYFKPEAKKRMMGLLDNLQQTYADRIQKLDWMSPVTKTKALGKLNTFMKKIGYTDKWKDYATVSISKTDYIANILSASNWAYNDMVSKLGKPVDKMEWGMTPPTVNAYYNPAFNEIVFPAGILQFPFFDFSADDAVNYGGIGAVIGHEMTHGFDDQGRLYDASGNLSDWWTEEDGAHFEEKANVVVEQFNAIVVIDTNHANGKLTEGENLADLGGVTIAYEAFKKTAQGKSNTKIDGFTPDQRFFLSWAQVWRANTRPQEIARRLKQDPHSPNELRCNVPLSNHAAWYSAFDIKPTDKLYRAEKDRARVW